MKTPSRFAFAALLALGTSFTHLATAAPVLNVDGSGRLLGASGVDVGGALYDVEFVDGSCVVLFDGFDNKSDFVFQTATDANSVSLALLSQIFADNALGNFDSSPSLINGCLLSDICNVYTPSYLIGPKVYTAFASNHTMEEIDTTGGNTLSPIDYDTSSRNADVYARWSPAAVVPLPATGWLLLSATLRLFGIGLRRKAWTRSAGVNQA